MAVRLDPGVGVRKVLVVLDQHKLRRAVEPKREVECVVVGARQHQEPRIHGTAEELDAIIGAVVNLQEFDIRAGADALERNPVQFVGRAKDLAGVTNLHKPQRAAVIGRQRTTIEARSAFAFRLAEVRRGLRRHIAGVDRRAAVDNNSTPFSGERISVSLARKRRAGRRRRRVANVLTLRKDNRLRLGAVRDQPVAARNDENAVQANASDGNARLDRQRNAGPGRSAAKVSSDESRTR